MADETIEILALIRKFAEEFSTSLYDTGFGYAFGPAGVRSAETREDMRVALAFVNGYAQGCRLANAYQSPQWCICNTVVSITGQLCVMLDAQGVQHGDTFRRTINSARETLIRQIADAKGAQS